MASTWKPFNEHLLNNLGGPSLPHKCLVKQVVIIIKTLKDNFAYDPNLSLYPILQK